MDVSKLVPEGIRERSREKSLISLLQGNEDKFSTILNNGVTFKYDLVKDPNDPDSVWSAETTISERGGKYIVDLLAVNADKSATLTDTFGMLPAITSLKGSRAGYEMILNTLISDNSGSVDPDSRAYYIQESWETLPTPTSAPFIVKGHKLPVTIDSAQYEPRLEEFKLIIPLQNINYNSDYRLAEVVDIINEFTKGYIYPIMVLIIEIIANVNLELSTLTTERYTYLASTPADIQISTTAKTTLNYTAVSA